MGRSDCLIGGSEHGAGRSMDGLGQDVPATMKKTLLHPRSVIAIFLATLAPSL
jgi:hypothetical protein